MPRRSGLAAVSPSPPTQLKSREISSSGAASSRSWRRAGLSSQVPVGVEEESASAAADVWAPPSPMALPVELCDRIVAFCQARGRPIGHEDHIEGAPTVGPGKTAYMLAMIRTDPGAPHRNPPWHELAARGPQLDEDVVDAVVVRLLAANERWWGLDLDAFSLLAKRYTAGAGHEAHSDWFPGKGYQGDKLGASVLLNDPGEYQGGDFVFRVPGASGFARVRTSRAQGTVIAFPSWTIHQVEPVTEGTRWVLLVNGYGPRLR